VFSAQRQSGAFVKTSMKLCQAKGCGQMREESAWSFVISEVIRMNANGARKAIEAAISTLWFATPSRKRRRRTFAGGRRRTKGAATAGETAAISAPSPRSAPSGAS
jgi:hypothetical protein